MSPGLLRDAAGVGAVGLVVLACYHGGGATPTAPGVAEAGWVESASRLAPMVIVLAVVLLSRRGRGPRGALAPLSVGLGCVALCAGLSLVAAARGPEQAAGGERTALLRGLGSLLPAVMFAGWYCVGFPPRCWAVTEVSLGSLSMWAGVRLYAGLRFAPGLDVASLLLLAGGGTLVGCAVWVMTGGRRQAREDGQEIPGDFGGIRDSGDTTPNP